MTLRIQPLAIENLENRLNLSTLGGLSVLTGGNLKTNSAVKSVQAAAPPVSVSTILAQAATPVTTTTGNLGVRISATAGAPTDLSATVTSTGVSLQWTDNSKNEDGFKVLRSTDGINFTKIGRVDSNITAYTDKTAAAGASYSYKVIAYVSTTKSPDSNIVMVSLPDADLAPPAPTAFTANANSTTSVTLTWTDNAFNEAGYNVYRSTDGTNFSLAGTLAADSTTISDANLAPGTQYYYKVSAFNSAGETFAASAVSATTPGTVGPQLKGLPSDPGVAPVGPATTSFTNITDTSLTVKWTDSSTNESAYHVYRSNDGINYTLVGNLAANSTSFADSGLTAGTTYFYKVAAWNDGGEIPSMPAGVTTTGTVGAQTGLTGSQTSTPSIPTPTTASIPVATPTPIATPTPAPVNQTTSTNIISLSPSDAVNLINSKLAAGKVVVANTKSTVTSGLHLVASHVYAVTGATQDADGNVTVELHKSWGNADGKHADVTLSFSDFAENFGMITA